MQMSAGVHADRDDSLSEMTTGRKNMDLLHARDRMKSRPDLPLEAVPV